MLIKEVPVTLTFAERMLLKEQELEEEERRNIPKMNHRLTKIKENEKIVKSSVKPYVRGSVFNIETERSNK